MTFLIKVLINVDVKTLWLKTTIQNRKINHFTAIHPLKPGITIMPYYNIQNLRRYTLISQ